MGTITSPVADVVVQCPFDLDVTATDDHGVPGAEFFLDGFPLNAQRVTKRPYRLVVDPTFVSPLPGACEGPRNLTAVVHDVADNTDTVDLQVNYKRPTKRPWPCPVADTLCGSPPP